MSFGWIRRQSRLPASSSTTSTGRPSSSSARVVINGNLPGRQASSARGRDLHFRSDPLGRVEPDPGLASVQHIHGLNPRGTNRPHLGTSPQRAENIRDADGVRASAHAYVSEFVAVARHGPPQRVDQRFARPRAFLVTPYACLAEKSPVDRTTGGKCGEQSVQDRLIVVLRCIDPKSSTTVSADERIQGAAGSIVRCPRFSSSGSRAFIRSRSRHAQFSTASRRVLHPSTKSQPKQPVL